MEAAVKPYQRTADSVTKCIRLTGITAANSTGDDVHALILLGKDQWLHYPLFNRFVTTQPGVKVQSVDQDLPGPGLEPYFGNGGFPPSG